MAERSLNCVMLIGRLGKDAETTFTPSGVAVTKFSLATSSRWKDKRTDEWQEKTEWHNIVLWKSENVAEYLLKGSRVHITGRLSTRSWEDKEDGKKRYMTEITCDDLILLGSKEGGGGDPPIRSKPRSAGASAPSQSAADDGFNDDDVPF